MPAPRKLSDADIAELKAEMALYVAKKVLIERWAKRKGVSAWTARAALKPDYRPKKPPKQAVTDEDFEKLTRLAFGST